jgi:hypothetical protein
MWRGYGHLGQRFSVSPLFPAQGRVASELLPPALVDALEERAASIPRAAGVVTLAAGRPGPDSTFLVRDLNNVFA